MNAQNTLTPKPFEAEVTYESNGESVKLSRKIIANSLISGGGSVTTQEIDMFLSLCRYQHLNPFLREVYLIKYGNSPAAIVTGKEVFTKRARRNKDYRGFEAGIIVVTAEGVVERRVGTFRLSSEVLVGGWAKVYIQNFESPVQIEVSLDEYIGRKKDGEVNGQWEKKPATMIRKVALVQALREAFPEDFAGMYSQEEFEDTSGIVLPTDPVEQTAAPAVIETTAEPVDDPLAG